MSSNADWKTANALTKIADAFHKFIDHWIKINPTQEEKAKKFNENLTKFESILDETLGRTIKLNEEEPKDGN